MTRALKRAFREFGDATGRHYDSVLPYRMEDAAYAIIGMGSMMETAESTVDFLRKSGMRIGCHLRYKYAAPRLGRAVYERRRFHLPHRFAATTTNSGTKDYVCLFLGHRDPFAALGVLDR